MGSPAFKNVPATDSRLCFEWGMKPLRLRVRLKVLVALAVGAIAVQLAAQSLPGTRLLTGSNDLAAEMVGGIGRYLERETAAAPARRAALWQNTNPKPDLAFYLHRFESNRVRFRDRLGLNDPRDKRPTVVLRHSLPVDAGGAAGPVEIARGAGFKVFQVSWTVLRGVEGEGLLLLPDGEPKGDVIALPDCAWTPEQLVGLTAGLSPSEQYARLCAEQGCRVLVPCLIDRGTEPSGIPGMRATGHSQRETLWRASYEMGRTVIGYELQKIFAAADWMERTRPPGASPWALESLIGGGQKGTPGRRWLGIIGHGEGGLLAYYAAACDTRFAVTYTSGYFGARERVGDEPIDRNVFGILKEFGDAEIGALIPPRTLFIEHGRYPEVTLTDASGGSPGRLERSADAVAQAEHVRLQRIVGSMPEHYLTGPADRFADHVSRFLFSITGVNPGVGFPAGPEPKIVGVLPNAGERTVRQYRQILDDTQWLMREGEYVRRDYWKKADLKSVEAFTASTAPYREQFRTEVVGVIPKASVSPDPQTRFLGETNGVRRYEVVLQVHPDVFAQGILCVPADIKPGERRPVVVCQHGLEGRPTDVSDPAVNSPYYHQYGLRLAERGFVTFAPQNPYIGSTRFRQVLHHAQPLGLTLWSFIVRQHEVITDWLAAQDFVDPKRIAFYGLSYGGKTAMRVPVLVDRYCLSICSADYNEWIWKNTSARSNYSYLFNNEYDMPEWNLGNTFNYAEMSWLICPRPFMVERGHDDGVAPDEWVAYEYAKTRRQYVKLGIADRTTIEFFDGPHSIHGVGTFAFLHQHLNWPAPR